MLYPIVSLGYDGSEDGGSASADRATFVSLLLAQAIAGRGRPVICVDTDPVNASLSACRR
jgi:hypothetical protein